ncbi:MAG: MgtC/SapB family protein [Gammaproteobacteria bacterium]|nr:MgtC/SapB family protein [Gammaproteobacteria bacterium]
MDFPLDHDALLTLFMRLGIAALLGFLIGLEREMGAQPNPHGGIRDFVMFALLGAVSALAAIMFDNAWLILVGFLGVLTLVVSGYWITVLRNPSEDSGITTEVAAVLTFFMGVLAMKGALALAVALGILVLAVLSQKVAIRGFGKSVQRFELDAALQFLIITFIVLPILPNRTLDAYFTLPVGTVTSVEPAAQILSIKPARGYAFSAGSAVTVYSSAQGRLGELTVGRVGSDEVSGHFEGDDLTRIAPGTDLRGPIGVEFISTLLSALNPYKIWLIVVLVSFVSFVGYVLIKIMGTGAGIGLTGLIGGLASSTVTTLSFSRRSVEMPQWNRNFAVAVILASSVMFPRLLLQIGIVNQALMKNMAVPILVMGATGLVMAGFFYLRRPSQATEPGEMSFSNPFSLKSAITFGLVFATILMVTRLAIAYLGEAWLPLIAVVSGLTDADAIAFSLSDAQQAGIISLDWASFNLVLGALSNTFMKLFLVSTLGHRGLFKNLLAAFLIIGAAGIVTMYFYYEY